MHDPAEETGLEKITAPRMTGPGSGKAAWITFAHRAIDANAGLSDLIDRQSATIRELKAEVALLKRQIASRKPKGGRPPLDGAKAAAIEADLRSGAWSKRRVAARHHVSPTTVQRIADRMDQRRKYAVDDR